MKNILIISFLFLLVTCSTVHAQDTTFAVYDLKADAISQIDSVVARAKKENKHVLLQIGGNWCKWCRLFYKWSHENKTIDSLLTADYVVTHVNFSKENKNDAAMKRLDFPQRFGFPVFVILDGNGTRLHTQNTGYLEDENGYSEKKVAEFLSQWSREAMKEENYKD